MHLDHAKLPLRFGDICGICAKELQITLPRESLVFSTFPRPTSTLRYSEIEDHLYSSAGESSGYIIRDRHVFILRLMRRDVESEGK